MEVLEAMNYTPGMSQTIEERVEQLEKKIAELSGKASRSFRSKDPWRTYGVFKGDPDFEEAVRLGRVYREQQTYEKEIAGSWYRSLLRVGAQRGRRPTTHGAPPGQPH